MSYCPQTLSDINIECKSSIGGVKVVAIRNRDDVDKLTIVDGRVTNIGLTSGAPEDATVIAFREQTCQLSSEGTIDDVQGTHFYTHTLAFRFPRMEATKRMSIHALTHAQTIAIVKDNNSILWLVGWEAPLHAATVTSGTGTAYSDPNEYVPALSCVSPELLFEVDSSAATSFLGNAVI